MKTKKIVVIENAKGEFLSVQEYGDEREFIWVSALTDVDRNAIFETWETKDYKTVLEHFPAWMHYDLHQMGVNKAKFVKYNVSFKKVG